MHDPDQINRYQKRLALHRRTLAHLLDQAARHGGVALAPPVTANSIAEARAGIKHCKDALRGWGVNVDDQPDDIALPPTFPAAQDQRNRAAMLQKVRDTWVTGLLDHSLYGAALITLGMETRPDAVSHPWATIVQLPDRLPCQLPAGTPIVQVFDDLRGELLILGAPGSGKTTMLLELARALLDRADVDLSHPMPVVFHLSTWVTERLPLAAWLVVELGQRYDVPRKLAQAWVDANVVLPLLDGLDEVQLEYRDACVGAINSFRTEHGLVSLVVCSRSIDYKALTSKLRLNGAVHLQPLSVEQVGSCLNATGDQLAGLRLALLVDPTLQELIESPLVLSIIMMAYQGQPAAALADLAMQGDRLGHLFAAYVRRMLARPRSGEQAEPEQMCHWLAWLARGMVEHSQSVFYIEYLQPTWPIQGWERRVYRLVVGLALGLALGLFIGLSFGLIGVLEGPIVGLVAGLVGGMLFGRDRGLARGMLFGRIRGLARGMLFGRDRGLARGVLFRLILKLVVRLLADLARGVLFGLILGLVVRLLAGLGGGLLAGLGGGLVLGLVLGLLETPSTITIVEVLHWSWSTFWSDIRSVLVLGLVAGLVGGLIGGLAGVLILGLVVGLVVGLVLGLVGNVFAALNSQALEKRTRVNEGIWRSLQNAQVAGLVGVLVGGLLGVLVGVLVGGVAIVLVCGLFGGLLIGLHNVWLWGGEACLRHFALRLIFWHSGVLPWNVAAFLDEAADRILLRRVGGGYIFIHRLLLEYFAGLEDAEGGSDGSKVATVQ